MEIKLISGDENKAQVVLHTTHGNGKKSSQTRHIGWNPKHKHITDRFGNIYRFNRDGISIIGKVERDKNGNEFVSRPNEIV